MPTMTKRVNVRATVAVRNTNPPIYGTYKNIIMTTGDILKCLTKRATVDEILPDGSTIRLNYKNYYTDNGAGLDANGETKIIKPKKPPVKKAAPKEPEKPAVDITFNEAPIANTAEVVNETTETVEKVDIEDAFDVLKNENGEEVDVHAGDLKDEPAEIETKTTEKAEPNAFVTERDSEEEIAITVEGSDKDICSPLLDGVSITVETSVDSVSNDKKISEGISSTSETPIEAAPIKEKTDEKTEVAPKITTATKKKSSSKKKK